jgi:hypothetical protein
LNSRTRPGEKQAIEIMSDAESTTSSDDLQAQNDLNNQEIVTKYRLAGEFANCEFIHLFIFGFSLIFRTCSHFALRFECADALQNVIAACKAGTKVVDLCKLGDAKVLEKTNTVYTKPVVIDGEKVKVDKGIAFPTCISVNNVLSNFSPSESDEIALKDGDVAKM